MTGTDQTPAPAPAGQPGPEASAGTHDRPRAEGYVPEVDAYLSKQKGIWDAERKQLEGQIADLQRKAQAGAGYQEFFDGMSADPYYGGVLKNFIDGVSPEEAQRLVAADSAPGGPAPAQQPNGATPHEVPDPVKNYVQQQITQFGRQVQPAYEMLLKMHSDQEVQSLIQSHPEAKDHLEGIRARVQATDGKLSLQDAFRLEYWDQMQNRARESGRVEGRRDANFRTEEPTAAGPTTETPSRTDEYLKQGNRVMAARLAMQDALKQST